MPCLREVTGLSSCVRSGAARQQEPSHFEPEVRKQTNARKSRHRPTCREWPSLRPNASSSTVYRLPKLLTGLSLALAREASELLDSEGPHARCETDRSTLELLPWNITVRKWFQNRSL